MVSSHEPIDQSEDANADDHRASRSKVLKGAHAAFNHEFSAIPCTLRDVSATGARVIFEGGWFVPDRFTLHVDIDGYKIECERVWQKGSECGVRFAGEKIITGKPRQQVLTPEPQANEAPAPAGEPVRPPAREPVSPRPALHSRGGGFGHRKR
jgi:hypothetical protein